jgi:predicted PurR-regulated permease PerM
MIGDSRAALFLLAVIALVLVTGALRASYPVTMPIAVAAVVIAAIWPVKVRLAAVIGRPLAYMAAVAALVVLFALFAAGLYIALAEAARTLARDRDRFAAVFEAVSRRAVEIGLPDPGKGAFDQAMQLVHPLLAGTYAALGYLGFIAVLVVLGLASVGPLRDRLGASLGRDGKHELLDAIDVTSARIRDYLGITTLMSVLTGAATALWTLLFGLDLVVTWGLLNFLLNYIPVIGNIIGILPPTLYALVQFDGWGRPAAIFAGLAVLQIVISNFVYPLAQGRSMALPPVVIVVALTFWSWVWGIAGALIAIPLTVAVLIACDHFPRTRWIATLLSTGRNDGGDGGSRLP